MHVGAYDFTSHRVVKSVHRQNSETHLCVCACMCAFIPVTAPAIAAACAATASVHGAIPVRVLVASAATCDRKQSNHNTTHMYGD